MSGVISGLNREQMFLPAFVCFDVVAWIEASNKTTILPPILGKLFADHQFPKITKFLSSLVFVHGRNPPYLHRYYHMIGAETSSALRYSPCLQLVRTRNPYFPRSSPDLWI